VRALGFDVGVADIDLVFDGLDEDGSGSIDARELQSKLRPGTMAHNRHALRKVAAKRQGTALSASERLDFAEGSDIGQQLKTILDVHMVRVIDLFREWDENGDGLVDKTEFVRAMLSLGFGLPKPGEVGHTKAVREIEALWSSFDRDGSGKIEYNELVRELRPRSPPQLQPPEASFTFVSRREPRQSLATVKNPHVRDALQALEQQDVELEKVRAGLKLIQGTTITQIDRRSPRQRKLEHDAMMHDLVYAATTKSRQQTLRKFQQGMIAPVPLGRHTYRSDRSG